MYYRLLITALFVIIFSIANYGETLIPPGVASGIWSRTASPYIIKGNIQIPHHQTLTIEAGTRIIFQGHFSIKVYGIIEANGTATDSILFTPANIDSGWHGIRFFDSEQGSYFRFCIFEFGKSYSSPSPDTQTAGVLEYDPAPRIPMDEFGGAILCKSSSPRFEHCLFRKNQAGYCGGAVFCIQGSNPLFNDCTFLENKSEGHSGGAISLLAAAATLNRCKIISNSAIRWGGGGIDCEYESSCILKDCTIEKNAAYSGGGVHIIYASTIIMDSCTVQNNQAKLGGGLKFNENCKGQISNITVIDNHAEYGGGIGISEACTPFIKNCNIYRNNAKSEGGGIFIAERSSVEISQCRIHQNTAANGGGISCLDSDTRLIDNQITNNTAEINGGGAYFEYSIPKFLNDKIVENSALRGGGLYFETCTEIDFNTSKLCNIYLNRAAEIGSDIFAFTGPSFNVNLDTFTVGYPQEIHLFPLNKIRLQHKAHKLEQVYADLYVSPNGSDNNSGLSFRTALQTLSMALSKIIADSLNTRTIHLKDGEYDARMLSGQLVPRYLHHVRLSGGWRASTDFRGTKIIVYTPWWNSALAYIIYFAIIIATVLTIIRVRFNRLNLQHQVQLKQMETEKIREIDEAKSRFFANISHEFRTPLTLIEGPVKQLISGEFAGNVKEQYQMILRNSKRLLDLVNQILDLSKIESGRMKLQVKKQDIIVLLCGLVQSFESLAKRKNIDFTFQYTSDVRARLSAPLSAYIDAEKLERIINNLLSNAFKFTPDGGRVGVKITPLIPPLYIRGDRGVKIEITNTGSGIPPDKIDHIFDRFYQVDESPGRHYEGTGIGLALVKEMVELHHGQVTVASEPGKITTFTVMIPVDCESYDESEICWDETLEQTVVYADGGSVIEKSIMSTDDIFTPDLPLHVGARITAPLQNRKHPPPTQKSSPVILIVDDNADVRQYIGGILKPAYRILEAADGEQGMSAAKQYIPDLIISDVMMPGMDGYELCRKVKTDIEISHIPVILLTARAAAEDKLEGLETGADDYITKPFEAKEMQLRIHNILEQRKRMRERFNRDLYVQPREITITSGDEQFLTRLIEKVEQKLDDPDLNVDKLSREIGISHTHLIRKLQALINMTPVAFIRFLRLRRARELLQNGFGNVTQVAFEVGFDSVSYFSRCYTEQFGVPPSRKKLNNDTGPAKNQSDPD